MSVVLVSTMGNSYAYCCLRTSFNRVGIEPQFSLIILLNVDDYGIEYEIYMNL